MDSVTIGSNAQGVPCRSAGWGGCWTGRDSVVVRAGPVVLSAASVVGRAMLVVLGAALVVHAWLVGRPVLVRMLVRAILVGALLVVRAGLVAVCPFRVVH